MRKKGAGHLNETVTKTPVEKEMHIVLDNLSAHKTKTVSEFLEQNPRVRFHFSLAYSSWLNQVEIWFAKVDRNVIARGIFTSVKDRSRKLMKYIRECEKTAAPSIGNTSMSASKCGNDVTTS